jgi:hypothetical protein
MPAFNEAKPDSTDAFMADALTGSIGIEREEWQ